MGPEQDGGESGFTLVEVMVAGALLSVLALGLVNAWAVFDRLTFSNLMRQKAVFVLNGEMERLAAQYTTSSYKPVPQSGYPALPSLTDSDERATYAAAHNLSFTTTSLATFRSSDTLVWLPGGSPPANWVWLDPTRDLVANLSWVSCPVTDKLGAACWGQGGKAGAASKCYGPSGGKGAATCQLVTVVLTYPYRLAQGAATPLGTPSTLTLSTIVGQRRG